MDKAQKAAVVDEIAEQLESAEAVFAVDYRGISVPEAAALRARLRDADATFRVVKNRLTLRAAEKAGAPEGLNTLLEGPTALTFVRGDAALAAKALHDFARSTEVLEFKGGLLGDEVLTVEQLRSIARLPAREVLYAQLVGTVAAPLSGLVRGLNGLIAGLAVQLRQIADQGLVSGEAPAEPAAEESPAQEAPASAEEAPASAEEAPASAEEAPASAEEAVEAGDSASSAAGPEGEHADEPAEGPEENLENEEADASAAANEDAAEA
jgi:large subunit ribosomal protein L10